MSSTKICHLPTDRVDSSILKVLILAIFRTRETDGSETLMLVWNLLNFL
jgi:hypothetical protein